MSYFELIVYRYRCDISHEVKRRLLLGRKAMTNRGSALKSRDITLPTKVPIVNAMIFPVVMYGCESWTIKKIEHWRTDTFELWCWRRLLRVPWTARSNLSILKEINSEYLLEGLMLKLKLQLWPVDSLENTLMLRAGGQEGNRGWDSWMVPPIQCTWVWANSRRWWSPRKPDVRQSMGSQSWTWLRDWMTTATLTPRLLWGFPGTQWWRPLLPAWELQGLWAPAPGRDNALEKEMATHCSVLAWRIPWTEEPGGQQSTGSQRMRHGWNNLIWAI